MKSSSLEIYLLFLHYVKKSNDIKSISFVRGDVDVRLFKSKLKQDDYTNLSYSEFLKLTNTIDYVLRHNSEDFAENFFYGIKICYSSEIS